MSYRRYILGGLKMIVKERQLEALFRRLPAHHPKRDMIVESLAKHKAGYKGEQAINYPLSFCRKKHIVFCTI